MANEVAAFTKTLCALVAVVGLSGCEPDRHALVEGCTVECAPKIHYIYTSDYGCGKKEEMVVRRKEYTPENTYVTSEKQVFPKFGFWPLPDGHGRLITRYQFTGIETSTVNNVHNRPAFYRISLQCPHTSAFSHFDGSAGSLAEKRYKELQVGQKVEARVRDIFSVRLRQDLTTYKVTTLERSFREHDILDIQKK